MARHKHADVMKVYAENTSVEIQYRITHDMKWVDIQNPNFNPIYEYRVKPPEPVVTVFYGVAEPDLGFHAATVGNIGPQNLNPRNNIKLTFTDGKLTKAEVL